MIDRTLIRDFPPMTATLNPDNTGVFRVGTVEQHVAEADESAGQRALLTLMKAEAAQSNRPVRVTVSDPLSMTVLIVGPAGEVEEESYTEFVAETSPFAPPPAPAASPAPVPAQKFAMELGQVFPIGNGHSTAAAPAAAPAVEPAAAAVVAPAPEPAMPVQRFVDVQSFAEASGGKVIPLSGGRGALDPLAPAESAPAAAVTPAPAAAEPVVVSRRDLRDAPSFLAPAPVGPAQKGMAGLLNSMGFKVAASAAELAEREDVNAVSRHFSKRRTISVTNRKGGANKTPTVVLLAAIFARYGGGGVAAWDNNETMGTLGWRTEQGGHESSVLDLIEEAEQLLSPGAEIGHLARFMHHQPADKYDVLRSAEDGQHVVTAEEVDLVHRVLAKYYRLILMDSGNSAGAPNWRRMVDHTDQLVIPTTTVEDRKEGALLTLKAVSTLSEKGEQLARNAVVIVSEAQAKDSAIANAYADDFRPYVRDVVVVPFDPAMKSGIIRHDALRATTQRAWLAAAAAVARGL